MTHGVRRGWAAGAAALTLLATTGTAARAATPGTAPGPAEAGRSAGRPATTASLPLGPGGLAETRTTQDVAPGVTLTTITRGRVSPDDHWTIEVGIPTSSDVPPSPDPDAVTAVVGTHTAADAVVAQLTAAGWTGQAQPVSTPAFADVEAGVIGYRVRVGRYATQDAANAAAKKLKAANFKPSVVYTGFDGDSTTGPWVVRALTVDFHRFHGSVAESHDATLAGRRTTTQIAQDTGALAAVNGGFFVISESDGVPGDTAGIVVEHGRLLHDATNGRVAAILRDGGRRVELKKLWTSIELVDEHGRTHRVEGLNRTPGVIRDCGGDAEDSPTSLPRHDVTCTDPNELAVFTPEFGGPLPTGPGTEAVLDAHGTVVSTGPRTATSVPAGGRVIEAIGTEASWLGEHAIVGHRLRLRTKVTGPGGRPVDFGPNDSVVNGGPQLVTDGRVAIAPQADGLVHPGDPSFYYGWVLRRNPRTMIGTDRRGRLLLVEADGRQASLSQGLSIAEAGQVMKSLGAVQAMNLDGGGSTTMVVGGQMINSPSDATGQRPVGDAVVVLPSRRRP
ncbi:phosphodiester glycosidase family protein [Actinoallomurus rhizosphaericola]|uniref:phosphodiester glycosidase family protein n=1 Tax=Actinoallomurus rhizosphaericola TaxID=2952536 RepID=UPI0020932FB7|nr:phosphodiester glycosidase family protein [Actinoallomurus rhizosphaericola]MCO5998017.1 phosphodiester glycosidase family protein [Actinoallomurus rhizosphaericola]